MHQYASKFGKLSSGHKTGKGQFSFQSWRKAMPKYVQTTYHTLVLISHTNKVMLKILQARLQQYMNWKLSDVQAGFRNGRGIRDQIVNIRWIIENAREFQKNTYFCFTDYAKVFDCVSQQTVANSSRDGNTRSPYLPPEKSLCRSGKKKGKWSRSVVPTLCNPMDCCLPGSSDHGIFQVRVLERVVISFSRGSSQPRDRTQVSHIAGGVFTSWATREALRP